MEKRTEGDKRKIIVFSAFSPQKKREQITIETMIFMYCHGNHNTQFEELCPACNTLLTYAKQRIDACPLREKKTTCAQCQIHCYKPEMREHIRDVMKYAGSRMLYKHPILTLYHVVDSLKSTTFKIRKDGK